MADFGLCGIGSAVSLVPATVHFLSHFICWTSSDILCCMYIHDDNRKPRMHTCCSLQRSRRFFSVSVSLSLFLVKLIFPNTPLISLNIHCVCSRWQFHANKMKTLIGKMYVRSLWSDISLWLPPLSSPRPMTINQNLCVCAPVN